MQRHVAIAFIGAILGIPVSLAHASTTPQWLKCSLTQDIVRDSSGKVTTKTLSGSVIFIIDDIEQSFYTYREETKTFTKLQANVKDREVTFYDGPLFDTIDRVSGTFNVVASPFHEAHGSCVPIAPLVKGRPKF